MPGWIIVVAIVSVVVLFGVGVYNSLISKREMVRNSMGQIAAQVESRWDALTNLIQATKNYEKHEAETLEKLTANRSRVTNTSSASEVEADSKAFNSALSRLIAVAEAYPDLKANTIYQNTMDSVNRYEENVRHSRMIFNDTVTKYNRELQVFPNNLFAGIFGFTKEEYFKNTEGKESMPMWN